MLRRVVRIEYPQGHGEPPMVFLLKISPASIHEAEEFSEAYDLVHRPGKTEDDFAARGEAVKDLTEFALTKLVGVVSIDGEKCPSNALDELKANMDLVFLFKLLRCIFGGDELEKKSKPSEPQPVSQQAETPTEN
jgi:hypothetical protein